MCISDWSSDVCSSDLFAAVSALVACAAVAVAVSGVPAADASSAKAGAAQALRPSIIAARVMGRMRQFMIRLQVRGQRNVRTNKGYRKQGQVRKDRTSVVEGKSV